MIKGKRILQTVSKKVSAVVRAGWGGFFLLLLFLPQRLLADPCTDPTVPKLCNPIKFPNFIAFSLELVNIAIQYGALLIVVFIVFAGFKFVTAQGNSEKVSEAKKMLTWIIVGAFVLLGVYVIKAAICGTIQQLGVTNACGLTTP